MDTTDKLRIAVDFDGVLFDHVPYVLRGFRDRYGIDLEAEGLRHWDYFQYRAVQEKHLSKSCVREVLMDIETDPLLHQEPPRDKLAVQVMTDWIAAGHTVDVVTARHPLSETVTRQFLEMNQVPYDALRMGVRKKTGYDVLIDDAPHNVLMAVAAGSYALLMDHPYNRDVPTNGNPHRVRTWEDVGQCVENLLEKRKAARRALQTA
jgi:uncharacterized HAD superfamily protein